MRKPVAKGFSVFGVQGFRFRISGLGFKVLGFAFKGFCLRFIFFSTILKHANLYIKSVLPHSPPYVMEGLLCEGWGRCLIVV